MCGAGLLVIRNLVVDLQLAVVRGGNAPHYVLSLLSWVLQGNNVGFRRFMVVVGCVMSTREVRRASAIHAFIVRCSV